MKIIITGATGAFGAAMTRYLFHAGHQIIATGRAKTPPKELLAYATYYSLDLTKDFTLPEADVCIHSAALSDDKATMKILYAPNVEGTRRIIEASDAYKKLIFISSSSVYLPQSEPILEDLAGKQNTKALSPYGYSKLLSEQEIHARFKGESAFILRPRAFYGAGDTQIMPRMLKLVKKGVFTRPGKLEIELSMTHYENIGAAITCCLASKREGINTYNVADDEVYTMIDTLRSIFAALYKHPLPEKEINIGVLKALAFFRVGGLTPLLVRALTKNMVLDITKIKTELGYRSTTNLTKSLPQLVVWVDKIGGPETLKTVTNKVLWESH